MKTKSIDYPIEGDIRPIRVDMAGDLLDETAWSGKIYYNDSSTGLHVLTPKTTNAVIGSTCRVIQSHITNGISLVPPADALLELPDGETVTTPASFRSGSVGSEIEILLYVTSAGTKRLRVFVKKGSWSTASGLAHTYTPSIDQSLLLVAGKKLTVNKSLTLDGTDGTTHTFPPRTSALKYSREIQRLTSADDTTLTLNNTGYAEDLIVVGSGVLYNINLGDATTYNDSDLDSKRFRIYNATPEFVGVLNTDLTTWLRIPPRGYCECILTDNSSASGVWHSMVYNPATGDPSFGFVFYDDGLGTGTTGPMWLAQYVSGAGASVGANVSGGFNYDPTQYGQGVLVLATGTTITGHAARIAGQLYFNGCATRYSCVSRPQNLSTVGVEEFVLRFGFHDVQAGEPTDGAYFEYDGAVSGDFWVICTANATTRTKSITAKAIDNVNYHSFNIEIASDASRADFFYDKALLNAAGGVTTNIPISNARAFHCSELIEKIAGTTTRHWLSEITKFERYPAVLRNV